MSVADSVAAALEGRSRLLVFDNCEHVLDAAADMIEAILAHSATVEFSATSREGLRRCRRTTLAGAVTRRRRRQLAAAALFVERARPSRPASR